MTPSSRRRGSTPPRRLRVRYAAPVARIGNRTPTGSCPCTGLPPPLFTRSACATPFGTAHVGGSAPARREERRAGLGHERVRAAVDETSRDGPATSCSVEKRTGVARAVGREARDFNRPTRKRLLTELLPAITEKPRLRPLDRRDADDAISIRRGDAPDRLDDRSMMPMRLVDELVRVVERDGDHTEAHAATCRTSFSAIAGGTALPSSRTTSSRDASGSTYESGKPMPRAYSRIVSGR